MMGLEGRRKSSEMKQSCEYIYLGYKWDPDPCIWFDELQQDLSSDVL